ncbi:MAG: septal ring lytic transglycosylase RlpA family protein [Persicimonas sp.]
MSAVKVMLLTAMFAQYQAEGEVEVPEPELPPVQQVGIASWYGNGAWHGDMTANGEDFDPTEPTCAHRSLPFNTVVLIENRANGRRAWCRINDRGPYGLETDDGDWTFKVSSSSDVKFRGILDMSIATAEALGTTDVGLQKVELRYWGRDEDAKFDLAVLNP